MHVVSKLIPHIVHIDPWEQGCVSFRMSTIHEDGNEKMLFVCFQ